MIGANGANVAIPRHPRHPSAIPHHPAPSHAIPHHPKPSQSIPRHPKPSQAIPSHPAPSHTIQSHPKPKLDGKCPLATIMYRISARTCKRTGRAHGRRGRSAARGTAEGRRSVSTHTCRRTTRSHAVFDANNGSFDNPDTVPAVRPKPPTPRRQDFAKKRRSWVVHSHNVVEVFATEDVTAHAHADQAQQPRKCRDLQQWHDWGSGQ